MKDVISVIIGFTPFHLIPMREIARSLSGELYFFHPMANLLRDDRTGVNMRFLGSCDSLNKSKFIKYFLAARELKALLAHRNDVVVFVPHPYNVLSNYAFFSKRVKERYIFQDGILNYYDAKNPLVLFKKRIERMVKAFAMLLPYRFFEGHLSGIDACNVSGGYFTHPEKIVSPQKFPIITKLQLPTMLIEGSKLTGDNGFVLFLDQPVEDIFGPQRALSVRRKLNNFIEQLGQQVLYKSHHEQKFEPFIDKDWIYLEGDDLSLPAELLVSKFNITNVVSFCSSALVNIAFENPDIQCYAVAAGLVPITINSRETSLAELLSSLGVIIVE